MILKLCWPASPGSRDSWRRTPRIPIASSETKRRYQRSQTDEWKDIPDQMDA